MSSQFKNRSKRKLFEEYLNADEVYIQLDPKHEGVKLPEKFGEHPSIALKLSLSFNFHPEVDDELVKATLKFDGEYFDCEVPWGSIWGMYTESGQSRVWKEDIPPKFLATQAIEVLKRKIFPSKAKKEADDKSSLASETKKKKKRPKGSPALFAVSSVGKGKDSDPSADLAPAPDSNLESTDAKETPQKDSSPTRLRAFDGGIKDGDKKPNSAAKLDSEETSSESQYEEKESEEQADQNELEDTNSETPSPKVEKSLTESEATVEVSPSLPENSSDESLDNSLDRSPDNVPWGTSKSGRSSNSNNSSTNKKTPFKGVSGGKSASKKPRNPQLTRIK